MHRGNEADNDESRVGESHQERKRKVIDK